MGGKGGEEWGFRENYDYISRNFYSTVLHDDPATIHSALMAGPYLHPIPTLGPYIQPAPHNKSGRWSPNSSCQLSPAKKPVGKIRQLSHFWHSSPTPPRPLSAPVAFFGPKITELGCFSDLTQDNRGLSVAPPPPLGKIFYN